jgi:hypothetical protein
MVSPKKRSEEHRGLLSHLLHGIFYTHRRPAGISARQILRAVTTASDAAWYFRRCSGCGHGSTIREPLADPRPVLQYELCGPRGCAYGEDNDDSD